MKKIVSLVLGMVIGFSIVSLVLQGRERGIVKDEETRAKEEFERAREGCKKERESIYRKSKGRWLKAKIFPIFYMKYISNLDLIEKMYYLMVKTAEKYEAIANTYPKTEIVDKCLLEAIILLEKAKIYAYHLGWHWEGHNKFALYNRIDGDVTRCIDWLIENSSRNEVVEFAKIKREDIRFREKERKRDFPRDEKGGVDYKKARKVAIEWMIEKITTGDELIKSYEALVNQYPNSEIADDCLYEIIKIIGGNFYYHYNLEKARQRSLKYVNLLYQIAPESEWGEDSHFIGGAFVELVRRYPKTRFFYHSLIGIMSSKAFLVKDTLWGYKRFMDKKIDIKDKLPFECDTLIDNSPPGGGGGASFWIHPSKEDIDQRFSFLKGMQSSLLAYLSNSFAKFLEEYAKENNCFPKRKVSQGNELYLILKPYIDKETRGEKDFNPFYEEYGLKLNSYESNGQSFKLSLELLDLKQEIQGRLEETRDFDFCFKKAYWAGDYMDYRYNLSLEELKKEVDEK
ncbi:MAG: hypothetical protein AB1630_11555 [bacterium]